MSTTAMHKFRHTLVLMATAALLGGCDNSEPLAPVVQSADLRGCEILNVPAGSTLKARMFAKGVQVYRWNGTSWAFVEPTAVLFSDAQGKSAVGTHYAGPTWSSVSGSKVTASVIERCTRDANAIPWLLLGATTTDGAGVFQGTKYIHRVNTVGGNAPATPGSAIGEIASVAYTAEYIFYQSQ